LDLGFAGGLGAGFTLSTGPCTSWITCVVAQAFNVAMKHKPTITVIQLLQGAPFIICIPLRPKSFPKPLRLPRRDLSICYYLFNEPVAQANIGLFLTVLITWANFEPADRDGDLDH
jgi:hypothetical protein